MGSHNLFFTLNAQIVQLQHEMHTSFKTTLAISQNQTLWADWEEEIWININTSRARELVLRVYHVNVYGLFIEFLDERHSCACSVFCDEPGYRKYSYGVFIFPLCFSHANCYFMGPPWVRYDLDPQLLWPLRTKQCTLDKLYAATVCNNYWYFWCITGKTRGKEGFCSSQFWGFSS